MTERGRPPVHRTTRRILGHATTFASRSPELVALADEAFAGWPRMRRRARIIVRIEIASYDDVLDAPLRYSLPGRDRLRIHGPGVDLRVDGERGRARGTIAADRLANRADLRYGVVEAATLFLLTMRDRVPFHAAAVVRDGHAVLLAGPTGAGKSTSAYAATHGGWSLLSEDCVFLQTDGPRRAWGWPGVLRLGPGAARFFPELAALSPAVQANGKQKIAMATSRIRSERLCARRVTLCQLSRTDGGPAIRPVQAVDLVRTLTERLEPGFDRFAGRTAGALLSVADPVAWILDPGSDPMTVSGLLDDIVDA